MTGALFAAVCEVLAVTHYQRQRMMESIDRVRLYQQLAKYNDADCFIVRYRSTTSIYPSILIVFPFPVFNLPRCRLNIPPVAPMVLKMVCHSMLRKKLKGEDFRRQQPTIVLSEMQQNQTSTMLHLSLRSMRQPQFRRLQHPCHLYLSETTTLNTAPIPSMMD
jgi:hypothetical protein